MMRSAMRSLEDPPGLKYHFDGDGRLDAVSDVMKLYEWRVADEFGKTVVNGHRGSCFLLRFDWCVIRFRIPGRWVERS